MGSADFQSGREQAESSAIRPSVSVSHSSKYWRPRRAIGPNDFQMDEDRLFGLLDTLGPLFKVNMAALTHRKTRGTHADLREIYGGKYSLTPKISEKKLKEHGFDHLMIAKSDNHPFLPPQPGWPGLMLRLDDDKDSYRPDGGTEFRVVVKLEPHFLEYVGQYVMVRLDDIRWLEWKKQPAKVSTSTCDSIAHV